MENLIQLNSVGTLLVLVGLCFDLAGVILLARPDSDWVSKWFPSHDKRRALRRLISCLEENRPVVIETENMGSIHDELGDISPIPIERTVFVPSGMLPWMGQNTVIITEREAFGEKMGKIRIMQQLSRIQNVPTRDIQEISDALAMNGRLETTGLRMFRLLLSRLNEKQRREGLGTLFTGFLLQGIGVLY